jgi:GT2 family glycosyltransferase
MVENWPTVSIVTVSVNGIKWLKGLFASILASDYPSDKIEVIYVDNGSIDGSVDFARQSFENGPNLRIIENKINRGWSPANNQGIEIARSEIILCISNDMEVDSRWIKEIVRTMGSDEKVGIAQCNSLSLWNRKVPDSGMNYLDKFGFAYSYAPTKSDAEVFYAEGMAFAIRKEVVREIGFARSVYWMNTFSWSTMIWTIHGGRDWRVTRFYLLPRQKSIMQEGELSVQHIFRELITQNGTREII